MLWENAKRVRVVILRIVFAMSVKLGSSKLPILLPVQIAWCAMHVVLVKNSSLNARLLQTIVFAMSVARGSTNPLILLLVPVAWRAQLVERAKKKKLHVLLQQTTVFAMSVARGNTNRPTHLPVRLVPRVLTVVLVRNS